MRRILIVLTGFAITSIATEGGLNGQGQVQSAQLTVTATATKNCTITTAPTPVIVPAFGRIFGRQGQDLPAGNYADSVRVGIVF